MVSRLGIEPIVLIDGAPSPYRCLHVEQSCGGGRLDYALLDADPGHPLIDRNRDPLLDVELKSFVEWHRIVEVVLPLPTGPQLVHRGMFASVNAVLSDRGPMLQLTSRVEPHHFGVPVHAMMIFSRLESEPAAVRLHEPLVFNPLVDGAPLGNRSQTAWQESPVFLDWRQSQTETAREWNGQGPLTTATLPEVDGQLQVRPQGEFWTLAEAVRYLCQHCNAEQRHVRNPNASQLANMAGLERIIRHIVIPLGLSLPEALDRVLEPHGWTWRLQYGAPGDLPTITLVQQSVGPEAAVRYQRPGNQVELDQTNCESFHLALDNGRRLLNRAYVLGAFYEIEATFELVRAWPADLDDTDPEQLVKGSPEWLLNPALARVWRDWVLNEAGDYVGLRDEITAPPDLNQLLQGIEAGAPTEQAAVAVAGVAFPVAASLEDEEDQVSPQQFFALRKRFLPTIALADDFSPAGEWNGIRVQVSLDGGATWSETGNENDEDTSDGQYGPIALLNREAGIRFDFDVPPQKLLDAGENVRVRVTATLRSDRRLWGIARSGDSVNPADVPGLFDLPARFACRLIHPSSTFYSDVAAGLRPAAIVDDRQRIQRYAEELLAAWNQADLAGVIVLHGIDHPVELGAIVTAIGGRQVGLATGGSLNRFPQIVGLSYDVARQSTTLHLTAFREVVL